MESRWLTRLVQLSIGAIVLLWSGDRTAAAECLSSAREVWSVHPGSHATYKHVDGKKCWFVRGSVDGTRDDGVRRPHAADPRHDGAHLDFPMPRPSPVTQAYGPMPRISQDITSSQGQLLAYVLFNTHGIFEPGLRGWGDVYTMRERTK